MTQDILKFAAQSLDKGQAVALITVSETYGSSPASPGQLMAVLQNGESYGTVGGGASEHQLVQQAVSALQNNTPSFTFSLDHSQQGMVCGGGMSGYGTVLGAGPRALLFGGGHIAKATAQIAAMAGFSVTVVEDRPELAAHFPNANFVLATPDEYPDTLHIDSNTYILICTRGHKTDDDALRFCLDKPCAYLGMIGSRRKVDALLATLRAEAIPQSLLDNIYAPVGLDIASAAPAEIAVAIVAEMLLVKNSGSPRHKRDV